MDLETLASAVSQIAEEHNISSDEVIDITEKAIASAYKKDYGKSGQKIEADFDSSTGEVEFWQVKEIIEDEEQEDMYFDSQRHILRSAAKGLENYEEEAEEVRLPLKTKTNFGRIAAQTAKQVILQKVQEAQRQSIFEKYKGKEGTIVSGMVQRKEGRTILFDLGDTLGILPEGEQIPEENYPPNQRMMLYILKVEETTKGPKIYLSRSYPKLVSALFKREVPEIGEEKIVIKAIAREAGSHTKVAVTSEDKRVDPIGAMVGQRGTRILAVTNELSGEKIDIIKWDEDPQQFVVNALSPAKALRVEIQDKNKALAIVEQNQLSLAIGSQGQNVRLAAQLTGWKIDVRSEEDEAAEDVEEEQQESGAEEEKNDEDGEDEEKKEVTEKEDTDHEQDSDKD